MKEKLKYSCIVDTVFSLLLYLLYTDNEDGKKTFFCVGDSVGSSIAERLPNCFFLHHPHSRLGVVKLRIKSIYYRIKIRKTQKYAQDHIYGVMLIGHSKYTLLEDGIGFFNRIKKETRIPFWMNYFGKKSMIKKIYRRLMYGSIIYDKILGINDQCVNRIITTQESINSEFIRGRSHEVVDIGCLWRSSSITRKKFILNVFGVSDEIITTIEQSSVLFLTSPFMEDVGISEEECYELLKPFYEKYINEKICIKPHPRESRFSYEKFFPKAIVIRTHIPMELFSVMGTKIGKIVSEGSSAICSLPSSMEIEYVDFSINRVVFERYGNLCEKKVI